jgi:hypothetical protein
MDSEDRKYPETSSQEEDEYCAVCRTVYAEAEECWCVEPDAGPGNRSGRVRSSFVQESS